MKYKVILSDPPWAYRVWSKKGEGRSAKMHYPTMSKEGIQNMDIASISDDDCALFLWVTMPCLLEGIELIERWGFVYKTVAFVWVKKNKNNSNTNFWGMGHWTRSNAELVLLATKGNPKRVGKGVHQIIDTFETETLEAKVGKHSQKPPEVRMKIEELMGEVLKVELFARVRNKGWDAFGNEVKNSIEIPNAFITPPHKKTTEQQPLFDLI